MNVFALLTMITITILVLPIMTPIMTNNKTTFPYYVKTSIMYAFMTSMIPTTMFTLSNQEIIISNWHWITVQTMKLSMSFKMDFSLMLVPVTLFVTWSIMEFSMWYMHSDPHINQFFKYLLLFLITMIILVTTNNLFQLFID